MTQPTLNFDNTWISDAIPRVLSAFAGVESFSADDLHRVLEEPMSSSKYGKLFRELSPHLVLIGYTKSKRPGRNGSIIGLWRVKE